MLDKNILEGLFRQHYGKMTHLARTLLGNDAEAQDVVQDVFARLLENEYKMTGSKTESYLMSAVRNRCINLIRKKRLQERVKNLYPIDETDDNQSIGEQMEELEQINAYVQAQVEEPHRSIFILRFAEDLTFKEIADRLGLSLGTVHKYLCQCIQQIRIHFNNE